MIFLASEKHYFDHLLPLYRELGGRFFVYKAISEYALSKEPGLTVFDKYGDVAELSGYMVVCSIKDIGITANPNVKHILLEHGAGQTYNRDCGSYANSPTGKKSVILYLANNKNTRDLFIAANPGKTCAVIGTPKLEELMKIPYTKKEPPAVAISFHWDCIVANESRSAFPFYKGIMPELAKRFPLLGHGHPRMLKEIAPYYEEHGIEVIEDFEDICRRADLYVADNTSTLFEFAALGRPVVVLNCPYYSREANHGLRFWECSDVGINCDEPATLPAIIERALVEEWKDKRAPIVDSIYEYRGRATNRAAEIIRGFINGNNNIIAS